MEEDNVKLDEEEETAEDVGLEPPVDEGFTETQVTVRALLVGGLAGVIVAVSNIYIGLKIGWSFGASQFAALLAFAILKPLSKYLNMPWGGYFGPKENCSAQTCGTAASMLSAGFTYAIPALYWTGALTGEVTSHILSFLLFTTAVGFFGMFFAVPMRTNAIIKQKLVFPSGTSTAYLIKSLHEGASGASEGVKKTKVMMVAFAAAMLYCMLQNFVPIVANFYIPAYCAENSSTCADAATLGWFLILSPLQIGCGLIINLNSSISMLIGCILAWGIIGPALYHNGVVPRLRHFSVDDPGCDYFLIWTAISLTTVGAFADLFSHPEIFVDFFFSIKNKIQRLYWWCTRRDELESIPIVDRDSNDEVPEDKDSVENKDENKASVEEDGDPAPPSEQVPTWVWVLGLVLSSALTMAILELFFGVRWYESLLANFLGFLLSFVAIQATGRMDVNPTGMVGKLTQLVFAGINPNIGVNLWSASVSAAAASQSVDMLQDLKTGHILRASPRSQLIAQAVGTFFGIFASVFGFILFVQAYPCTLQDPETPGYSCPFPMPAVIAWYGMALGLTSGFKNALPPGSPYGVLTGALTAILLAILRKKLPEKYSAWVPTSVGLGLGFLTPAIIPQSIMFFTGSVIALIWKKINPDTFTLYAIVISAGFIAGEGVGGILNAVILIAGYTDKWTCWGIPNGYC